MKPAVLAPLTLAHPHAALVDPNLADLTLIDPTLTNVAAVHSFEVCDVATLTPRTRAHDGTASILRLSYGAGDVVPAHATETGLRFLSALSRDISRGDRATISPASPFSGCSASPSRGSTSP